MSRTQLRRLRPQGQIKHGIFSATCCQSAGVGGPWLALPRLLRPQMLALFHVQLLLIQQRCKTACTGLSCQGSRKSEAAFATAHLCLAACHGAHRELRLPGRSSVMLHAQGWPPATPKSRERCSDALLAAPNPGASASMGGTCVTSHDRHNQKSTFCPHNGPRLALVPSLPAGQQEESSKLLCALHLK